MHLKLHYFLAYQFKRVLGAQKNCLIETVLLSTHNICFGGEIRKIIFQYALLSGGLRDMLKLMGKKILIFLHS